MSLCPSCGTEKPVKSAYCQSCAYDKHIFREYGLTPEGYDELYKKQGGCCAICKEHQSRLKKRLCVDHHHASGDVRGLLCVSCNNAIGLLKDDALNCFRASKYLRGET